MRLSDSEILAYIDGQAGPETITRIENSPENLERAGRLKLLQAGLRARLHRADCPDTLMLGEYFQGLLHPGPSATIRRHLASCPYCQAEFEQLQAFFEGRPGWQQSIRTLVAGRLPGSMLQSSPALGLRGGEAPQMYTAGEWQIMLAVQSDSRKPGVKSLAGLVLGQTTPGWEAHLLGGAQAAQVAPLDEIGNFIFADLIPGDYELHLYTLEEDIFNFPAAF